MPQAAAPASGVRCTDVARLRNSPRSARNLAQSAIATSVMSIASGPFRVARRAVAECSCLVGPGAAGHEGCTTGERMQMWTTVAVLIGAFAGALLLGFRYFGRRDGKAVFPGLTSLRRLLRGAPFSTSSDTPPSRPWRVLVAIDGSPCSDDVLGHVASRLWPAGSEIKIVSVVHTNVPARPPSELVTDAAATDALDRDRAPIRVLRAEHLLAATGIPVHGQVLDGDPEQAIVDEAERWNADLIVVGSHGFGPRTPHVLGPISSGVAQHAHRSVEIVHCSEAEATGDAVPQAATSV
jgi:nucleotide-binding universal stress UspA family protein